MNNCNFCIKEKIQDGLLYETKNFQVKIPYGVVIAGHVMIITKKHYPCLGAIPDELDAEYEELKQLLKDKLTKEFALPILIEYGAWGQSVPHAHIHFIPATLKEIPQKVSALNGINFEAGDFKRIKEVYQQEGAYVSMEENGQIYIFHVRNLPEDKNKTKMDFRYFFPQISDLKCVRNWQNMSEEEKIEDEKKREETRLRFP